MAQRSSSKKLTAKSKEIWFYEEAKNSREKQR